MIKAILLDLDNTLLQNNDAQFAQVFIHSLTTTFQNEGLDFDLGGAYRSAIRKMADVEKPFELTNHSLIVDTLASAANVSVERIEDCLRTFYSEQYPALRDCVSPEERAPQLVNYVMEAGYALVIATNPIYSASAIQHRLEWTGLPASLDHYTLVTHAENMHFAKPDPAYYTEILARVGIEPDEAIMVGDRQRNDVDAARAAGLHAFHIINSPDQRDSWHGNLDDFIDLIQEEDWRMRIPFVSLAPEMIEPQLRGNVGALFGMIINALPHFWTQHPDPEEWSILQIVCHLMESESVVQRPRLERILREDNPFIAPPQAPPGPQEYICEENGIDVARQFASSRRKTFAFLRNLTHEEWNRPARHSIFGPTTLLEMAHFTAQHDRLHLNQLCQTLGNCQ